LAPGKKIIIDKNTTVYTWDWYCHLGVDRASLKCKVVLTRLGIYPFLNKERVGC